MDLSEHQPSYLTRERDRFLWLPVAFGAGIGGYFALENEPSHAVMWGVFIVSLCVGAVYCVRRYIRHTSAPFLCGAALMGLGLCTAFLHTHMRATPMIHTFYKNTPLQGIVEKIEDRGTDQRLTLRDVRVRDVTPGSVLARIQKVRLKASIHEKPVRLGDHVSLVATLVPFSGPYVPHGLNMRRQAFFDGLSAQGRIKKIISTDTSSPHKISFWERVELTLSKIRHTISTRIKNHMPKDVQAIAVALVTGERSYLQDNVRQAFVDAGIAHVLAISGLHLGIIAAFLFMILRGGLALIPVMAERYPIKKITAVGVIVMCSLYTLLAGAGYPVQRAFFMITLGMLAICVDRSPFSLRLLAIAALVILVVSPQSLLSASFQLSFSAVVAIIGFYESCLKKFLAFGRRGGRIQKTMTSVVSMLSTTCIATLATTPFTIFIFNRFTAQALLGNMLALPLVSMVVMPLAFVCTLSLSLGGSDLLFQAWALSLTWLQKIAFFVAAQPGAGIVMPTPPFWVMMWCVFGGLWLILMRSPPYYMFGCRLYGVRWWSMIPLSMAAFGFGHDFTVDVIVSNKTLAYKHDGVVYVSPGTSSFEAKLYQRYWGASSHKVWADHEVYIHPMMLVSWDRSRAPLWHNVTQHKHMSALISNRYVPSFVKDTLTQQGVVVMDRKDLKHHAIWGIYADPYQRIAFHDTSNRPWNQRLFSRAPIS